MDRRAAAIAELDADVLAVWMIYFIEDTQSMRPGAAGSVQVPRAAISVANVVECIGFVVLVGEFAAKVKGPLIACNGLLIVTELMVDVAETVPGGGFPAAFT